MTTASAPAAPPPRIDIDDAQPSRLRLSGRWTLEFATQIGDRLAESPCSAAVVDATAVERLDSIGVLQLIRFARRNDLDFDAFEFRADHRALVAAIEDVPDDRPRRKREFGFNAALARLGVAVTHDWKEFLALIAFFGEVLVKLLRIVKQPSRFRPIATVHHMEQVGLDAVPLVALLSYLVGAVIAFLGATILKDFGAEIYVVELVNVAFLREFGVLMTAILIAGRTASAFTAQIGAMVSREEVDAIRTLGMDPIDLLVIPRVLALLIMLPLLTFVAMIAGLLGGLTVGAYGLDIPPQQYLARMQETMELRHFLVGRPMALEIVEKARPVGQQTVNLEIAQRESA